MPHFECGAIDHSATSPDATLASVFRAYCGKVESGFFRPKSHLRVSTGPAAGKMMGPPRGGQGVMRFLHVYCQVSVTLRKLQVCSNFCALHKGVPIAISA